MEKQVINMQKSFAVCYITPLICAPVTSSVCGSAAHPTQSATYSVHLSETAQLHST